ncbi:MAG: PA0069 family radical SAM protein [Gammaproteobacteria bacterium]|nr:PA0069 family radical SAM protein [Gammaproteobacteria bacterium]MBT8110839.1 PA0069 family radical SAM protein [Gammaproteobacteria bacterium]NNL45538.1 PA0069 family radical SAM protein [Woeseiaceae bacterium]
MPAQGHKGRGAISSPDNRFTTRPVDIDEDEAHARAQRAPETVIRAMPAGRIISSNNSPDVPFDRSINPYLGCEHGCVYCYARPSHSYLDLSPGLDFETQIFFKPNAAAKLIEAWEKPGYECKPITIGANTDPYQPAEKSLQLTRQLLLLFLKYRHPVNIITKGNLVCRDIDLLAELAGADLCSVAISLPTMNADLKRIMEPRVPSAAARLKALSQLNKRGVPTSVLVAPIIPAINDNEIENILKSAAAAGAQQAKYIFLRLPHELKGLFAEWLQTHFPDRAERVSSLIRQASGGSDYDNRFGVRQTGRGPYAEMLAARFKTASRRCGIDSDAYQHVLDCNKFFAPGQQQMGLDF